MRFINQTPLPAAFVPNSEEGDRVTALFVCAITYRIVRGRLEPTMQQKPLELGSEGPVPNDVMWGKTGASVGASGFVYAPGGDARQGFARLRIGGSEISIAAFGPRVWQKSMLTGALTPSSPLSFQRVAMTWQNAFGGVVDQPAQVVMLDEEEAFLPEHETGYPLNFDGAGFYTDAAQALDHPLPQLEHPDHLIHRWDDRPEPVCFAPCPLWSGLRSAFVVRGRQLEMAGAGKISSRAAPRTTFDAIEPCTPILLTGMRPRGEELAFEVPRCPVAVHVRIGDRADVVVPVLDAIDIDAEAAEVRLLYRAVASYDLIQYELRTAEIEPTADFPAI